MSISTSNRVKEKSNRDESKLFCWNVSALAETAKRRAAAAGAQRRRCCRCRNDAFSVTAAVETFIGVRSSCCCCCVADAGNNSSAVEITEAWITKVQSTSYRSAISVNLAGQSLHLRRFMFADSLPSANAARTQLLLTWPRNLAYFDFFLLLSAGYLSLTHLSLINSENITINHIAKTAFFGLHFCRRKYGSVFNHSDVIGPTGPMCPDFGEITQNNGHCTVQGHSRLPVLVPMECPYSTSMCEYTVTSYFVEFPR